MPGSSRGGFSRRSRSDLPSRRSGGCPALTERERRYLAHIRDSITRIQGYLTDHPDALGEEGSIRDAVIWRLETIGEASTHLSDELRARHPEIPWQAVRGFRNIAAHGYLVIRPERVVAVVRDDIPLLLAAVETELARGAG